jgi:hypothetical protein
MAHCKRVGSTIKRQRLVAAGTPAVQQTKAGCTQQQAVVIDTSAAMQQAYQSSKKNG